MGDDDANLEIAKHYLQNEHNPRKAIVYLKKVRLGSKNVILWSKEEATRLLREV